MSSPKTSASEKSGSSPETEKTESSPESEIECGCQIPTTTTKPSPLSPPPHAHRKQSDTFESPPPPKRSKSIFKNQNHNQTQKHPGNANPLPRALPKESSLETHKAALAQGAFLKTLEFRRKMRKQLDERWATEFEHSFSSRPRREYSAYTLERIREYHGVTGRQQGRAMRGSISGEGNYIGGEGNRYGEKYGMGKGEYFGGKDEGERVNGCAE